MKKCSAIFLALVLMLAGLSGCGSSKFRTLDEIKASGEIVMLTEATFAPYEYMKGENIVGSDVEIAQMIADELGVTLTIINMDFDMLVEALKSGKGDFVAAGMAHTEKRAKQIDFSHPYFANKLLVVVKADSGIQSPDDLAGKVVALQKGTTSDDVMTSKNTAKELLRFTSAVDAVDAVTSGKADAAVMDVLPAEKMVAKSNGKLAILDQPVGQEDISMAVAKGNSELLDVINGILDKAVADGTVQELIDKHKE